MLCLHLVHLDLSLLLYQQNKYKSMKECFANCAQKWPEFHDKFFFFNKFVLFSLLRSFVLFHSFSNSQ